MDQNGDPSSSDSSIPTFKIESENSDVTQNVANGHTGHEKNEPSTSKDLDGAEDSSRYLPVPSKEARVHRTSSLKIEKSSSGGTSSDKKIVRFADALGLDLVAVKIFANDGSIPNVPTNAFSDLKISFNNAKLPLSRESKTRIDLTRHKYELVQQFEQPESHPNFMNRVKDQKVCLEKVFTFSLGVKGIVRILNLHYRKVVLVRYTTDDWESQLEQPAKYIEGSTDSETDKFTFTIHANRMKPGDKLTFAVKYKVLLQEFWDNNNSNNYTLLCKERNETCRPVQ